MIEVSLGYKTLRNWRELHERVEALQRTGAVFGVDAISLPARWLANVVTTVTAAGVPTVLLVKVGDEDWRPIVVAPLATFEGLTTHNGYESSQVEADQESEQPC